MYTRHYMLFNNWRNNLGNGHITLSFRAIWICIFWIHFRCLQHSIHSSQTFLYCSQLSPYYRMLFMSITKFYYIFLQNLLFIYLVDSVQFMAYYYILNLHVYLWSINIRNSVFLDKFSLCYILKEQITVKLYEEILHINYQLLPTVTIVMLVIKAAIRVCRCLCKMPVILARC